MNNWSPRNMGGYSRYQECIILKSLYKVHGFHWSNRYYDQHHIIQYIISLMDAVTNKNIGSWFMFLWLIPLSVIISRTVNTSVGSTLWKSINIWITKLIQSLAKRTLKLYKGQCHCFDTFWRDGRESPRFSPPIFTTRIEIDLSLVTITLIVYYLNVVHEALMIPPQIST